MTKSLKKFKLFLLVDYYERRLIDNECFEKLHKLAQRILKNKDMSDEDKLYLTDEKIE